MSDPHGASAASLGLSSAEAARRLSEVGANELPPPEVTSLLRRLLRQLRSPLVLLLLAAVGFDLAAWAFEGARSWPFDATIIALILLSNATLAVLQERRSERALERLATLAAPRARAYRDGRPCELPARELVPGDVVRIEAGERIPADAQVLESQGLALDESLLTGESLPVERGAGERFPSGTLALRGSGLARVAATGATSEMGRLATRIVRVEAGRTPLEERLDVFGRRVAVAVTGIALALFAAGLAAEGWTQLRHLLLFAVALAVSAVPEGLPAVVTLALALGVHRMARRQVVVRRLEAVEALGSVTVIATDKTGTLTENRLRVERLDSEAPDEALLACVLANDAEPGAEFGDPLESALLAFAASHGLDSAALRATWRRVAVEPFDSALRLMGVSVASGSQRRSYWKGAPEALLACAAGDAASHAAWLARAEAHAAGGFRVIGVARGANERAESLEFLGLVALWDPPRAEVPRALEAARRAGIRTVMLTGDHPLTALTVARRLGLAAAEEPVVTGAELDALGPAALGDCVRRSAVFARVSPEHKLAIVEALLAQGEVVAVTGDGVNDAPALKRADVGIAMGRRGSDVAREVADLVLLDDDYASIVSAVREGRGIFANIQGFVRFLFATNAAELLLVVAGSAAALAFGLRDATGAVLLPLTAVQILWINLLTDGLPALALALDRHEGLMERPPRPRASPLFDRPSLRFVFAAGGGQAALGIGLLFALPTLGAAPQEARTGTFLYVALAQLLFAYSARRIGGQPLANPWLHVSIATAAALQLACLALPGLREALGLAPLAPGAWVAVLGCVALSSAAAEATLRWLAGAAQAGARRTVSTPQGA